MSALLRCAKWRKMQTKNKNKETRLLLKKEWGFIILLQNDVS